MGLLRPPDTMSLSSAHSSTSFDSDEPSPGPSQPSSARATPAPPGRPGPVTLKRRPKQGRVVDALREQQHTQRRALAHSSTLHIGPTSSASVLSSYALQTSLNWHLISVALNALQHISSSAWGDLTSSLAELRVNGPSEDNTAYKDALCAVAASFGARISMHSSITGVTREESERGAVDELSLGRRREAACVALAKRAMLLADEGALLEEDSARGRALAVLMRSTFSSLVPAHADARRAVISLGHQLEAKTRAHRGDNSLLHFHDAIINYTVRGEPLRMPADMRSPTAEELASIRSTNSEHNLIHTWSKLGFVTFATLSRLQHSTLIPTAELVPTFTQLFQAADVCISLLPALKNVFTAVHPTTRELVIMRFVAQMEVAIYEQAKRHLQGRSRTLWNAAQVRLVAYVALFVRTMPNYEPGSTTTHLIANNLMVFEAIPEWTELVVEGAVDHAAGDAPLAKARLTVLDLPPLHEALKKGAGVFAALGDRERDFARALGHCNLAVDGAEKVPQVGRGECQPGAAWIVERALADLLAS